MKFLNYTQTNKFLVGMHRVRLKKYKGKISIISMC